MGEILAFWWRVLRMAIINTIRFFSAHPLRSIFIAVAIGSIGLLLDYMLRGLDAMLDELHIWTIYGLGAFGLLCLIVLLINCTVIVPARLFSAKERENEALRAALESRLDDAIKLQQKINRSIRITDELMRAQKAAWYAEFFVYLATKHLDVPTTATLDELEAALRRAEASEDPSPDEAFGDDFYYKWERVGEDTLSSCSWAPQKEAEELERRYEALQKEELKRMRIQEKDEQPKTRFLRVKARRVAAWRMAAQLQGAARAPDGSRAAWRCRPDPGVAEEAGILLVVHENFRFQPWHQEIRRQIDAGAIGEPYQATFRLRPGDGQGPRAYLDRQPYFQQMERFLVHETGIHFIDTFRFLFGEVDAVLARLRRLNPKIAGEDAGFILFEFASGVRALFDGNRLADHAADNRRLTMGEMLIEGSSGTIRLDGNGRLFRRAFGENEEREIAYAWENAGFAGDSVMRLQRHLVDHLRGRGPLHNAARSYLTNLQIENAVYASSASGALQPVRR